VITGADDADSIDGGTGADTITGAGGADTIYGKAGADSIDVSGGTGAVLNVLGGTDNDTILVAEATLLSDDILKGQDGTDVLQIDDAATLIDTQLKGVSGIETLEFVLNTGAAVIGANAQAAGITVVDMDSVAGDAGTLSAATYTSAVALSIVGATGDDSIAGGAGNDTISGGTNGEDTLTGGAGADFFTFLGTDGDDKILTDLGNGADNFTLAAAVTGGVTATVAANYTAGATTFNNALTADAVITGSGFDVNMSAVTLGTSGFKIDGTNNAATLTGSALADSITGGTAADSLTGGAGADTIDGNGGADSIAGGDGNDEFQNTVAELSTVAFTMTGGAGTDTLSITDAQDAVDLTAAAVTGMEALVFDTADGDNGADATTIDAGMFSTGAATFTITGGADTEADTLVITAKTTNFDNAAEASIAAVNVAGEWFFDAAVGGNGVFTYYNEETSGITTLTLTGTTWAMGAGGATITATL